MGRAVGGEAEVVGQDPVEAGAEAADAVLLYARAGEVDDRQPRDRRLAAGVVQAVGPRAVDHDQGRPGVARLRGPVDGDRRGDHRQRAGRRDRVDAVAGDGELDRIARGGGECQRPPQRAEARVLGVDDQVGRQQPSYLQRRDRPRRFQAFRAAARDRGRRGRDITGASRRWFRTLDERRRRATRATVDHRDRGLDAPTFINLPTGLTPAVTALRSVDAERHLHHLALVSSESRRILKIDTRRCGFSS